MRRFSTARVKRNLAMTLVEVMVASSLMIIVVFAVYEILAQALAFYTLNATMNDQQRGALSLLANLNQSVQNSQIGLDYVDNSVSPGVLGATDSLGITVSNCFNATTGQTQFDPNSTPPGLVMWQGFIVYWLNPNGDVRMANVPITPPTSSPQAPGLTGGNEDPFNYATTSNTSGKLIAQGVSALNFQVNTVGAQASQSFVNITVMIGTPGTATNSYCLNLTSAAYPRN